MENIYKGRRTLSYYRSNADRLTIYAKTKVASVIFL